MSKKSSTSNGHSQLPALTWEIQSSAWWYKYGNGDYQRAHNLFWKYERPIQIVGNYLATAFFCLFAYFGSPFNSQAQSTPSATILVLQILHWLFAYNVLLYVIKVLFLVPWKDTRYPLVADVTDVAMYSPHTWMAWNFVIFAAIAFYVSPKQSIHVWAIGFEGLALLYFNYGEPAFGFVKWRNGDQARNVREGKAQGSTQAVANSTPAVNADDDTYQVPVTARKANLKFDSIFGMASIKEKLLAPSRAIIAQRAAGTEQPRNGILLFGEPGNGKSVFAEALAGELGLPFIELTYGQVSSQWVGNMPKVLSKTFAYAKRSAPCVLFVDEIDSFIKSRDTASGSSEDQKITNTLLTEIVALRSHQVILIGATNYLSQLDAAAVREGRFDYKVEITPPDEEARIGLIQAGVRKYGIGLDVDPNQSLSVAKRWNGFSVARLMGVCKALPDVAKKTGSKHIGLAEWQAALREVQGRRGKLPANTKTMVELVLDANTRNALNLIASRLKDVARIEAMGGTLPTGVLFHGPSGTGKTAAARAMAREAGWAFLSVAGPDLISDRTKLDKLFAEAKDIRPTIIFIDEADDVLRNRQYSATPDMVNKLLTLMDGADDRVQDVVWVAATNNPDQIEPALLRSGRFTEKVLFAPPPQDMVPRHIALWMKGKGVAFAPDLDAFDVAERLEGQTIADIEGVLQYALNNAIGATADGNTPVIKEHDLQTAIRIVLNQESS